MLSFHLFSALPPELRIEIWAFAIHGAARARLVLEQEYQVFATLNLVAASPFFSVCVESRDVAREVYCVRLPVYRQMIQGGGGLGKKNGNGGGVVYVTSLHPPPPPSVERIGMSDSGRDDMEVMGSWIGEGKEDTDTTKNVHVDVSVVEVVDSSDSEEGEKRVHSHNHNLDKHENNHHYDNENGDDYQGSIYLSPAHDVLISLHPQTKLKGLYEMNLNLILGSAGTLSSSGGGDDFYYFDRSPRSRATAWLNRTSPLDLTHSARSRFQRRASRYCLVKHASERLGVGEWREVREWIGGFEGDEYKRGVRMLRGMGIRTWQFEAVFGW
ncbi:hypothetical protein F5Y17DRAFT_303401 [Xylariaceae sp. FL0594]|nr:hypothetical protein F5Y17DRAFT_303401 [Xylariaceae sp. FL0594]